MSNFHPPSGDSLPHDDHDLHRLSSADVSNDADALDDRLNEIARNQGSPSTRPTSTAPWPDARTTGHRRLDADESLATAAASFHQQVEAAQSRHARAARPDPQLWEKIMKQAGAPAPTPAAPPSAMANPWTSQPSPPGKQVPTRSKVGQRPPQSHRQQLWNLAANIGLVVALLLAGFGVWRIAGEPGLPGGSGDDPMTPQFAMQPSTPIGTPEATEQPAVVVAPPVATPQPTTDCDFRKDIPIFVGADTSPVDGTAVLLTTGGDVLLTCDEEPNDTTLATGISQIAPMTWPGTVILYAQDGPEGETHISVLNLLSGKSAPVGLISESAQVGNEQNPRSPWLVVISNDDPTQWEVIDLRTMETSRLSKIAGTALPENNGYLLSADDAGDTLVLALLGNAYATKGNATLITKDLPGDLLVINGSLDKSMWVSVPDDFPPVVGFDVSPDGKYIALHGAKGRFEESEHTYSIVRLSDQAEVARSSTFISSRSDLGGSVWVPDGIAYTSGNALKMLPVDSNEGEHTVFETDGPLTDLRQTTAESTVLVDQQWASELSTMVPNQKVPMMFSVDISSGKSTMLTGVDISDNVGWWTPPDRFLVMYDPQVEPDGPVTYRVVDATTGEQVGEIADVPLHDNRTPGIYYPQLGIQTVVSSNDGETEIIAFDSQHIYLMRMVDGTAEVRQLPSPPGVLSEVDLPASMVLNSDGSMLSLSSNNDESRTRWLLDLSDDEGGWIEVPAMGNEPGSGFVSFVPGTGD